MRVTGNSPQPQVQRPTTGKLGAATHDRGRTTTPTATTAPAEVRVSSASKGLAGIKAPETPDAARIERLRGLVESGSLPVDAGAIADAMLREER